MFVYSQLPSRRTPTYKQYQKLRLLSLITATFVLMTSASVLSSDHKNSKSSGVLDVAVSSNVASQNRAAVPSPSSLSMSSSKVFPSSTLAISSSSFAVLSAKMAKKLSTPAFPLALSKLVTSTVVASTSDVPSIALSRSDSSSSMSASLITEQGTSDSPPVCITCWYHCFMFLQAAYHEAIWHLS